MHQETGAEGKLCLATLLKVLLSLAGLVDQKQTVDLPESYLSVCISYHLEVLGVSQQSSIPGWVPLRNGDV